MSNDWTVDVQLSVGWTVHIQLSDGWTVYNQLFNGCPNGWLHCDNYPNRQWNLKLMSQNVAKFYALFPPIVGQFWYDQVMLLDSFKLFWPLVDQWEAGIWSCDLRANERPWKKLHYEGTDRHISHPWTDIATTRKNLPKGRFFENIEWDTLFVGQKIS